MKNIYKINFITSGIFLATFIISVKNADYAAAFPALGAAVGWFAYATEVTKSD